MTKTILFLIIVFVLLRTLPFHSFLCLRDKLLRILMHFQKKKKYFQLGSKGGAYSLY